MDTSSPGFVRVLHITSLLAASSIWDRAEGLSCFDNLENSIAPKPVIEEKPCNNGQCFSSVSNGSGDPNVGYGCIAHIGHGCENPKNIPNLWICFCNESNCNNPAMTEISNGTYRDCRESKGKLNGCIEIQHSASLVSSSLSSAGQSSQSSKNIQDESTDGTMAKDETSLETEVMSPENEGRHSDASYNKGSKLFFFIIIINLEFYGI